MNRERLKEGFFVWCKKENWVASRELFYMMASILQIWDGYHTQAILQRLRRLYATTKIIKPESSRSESSETFILARSLKS